MPLDGQQLGFLEKIILIIEKYGIFKIFKALCVMTAFIYLMYNAQNMDNIIKNIVKSEINTHSEEQKAEHDAVMDVRREVDGKVQQILKEMLYKLDADRAFVMEFHNGNNNTSGLPFIYGEVTYEVEEEGIFSIGDDYTNMNLSRYTFPTYLETAHVWVGTIDELAKVDNRLSKKLSSNDVTYFAIVRLQGLNTSLGYLGLSYCNDKTPVQKDKIMTGMVTYSQHISVLLDAANR